MITASAPSRGPRPDSPPKKGGATWMFDQVADTYNMAWKMVIRPPRDKYSYEDLGPIYFRIGRQVFERRDIQLPSGRGLLQCSHFVPAKSPDVKRPCVVYLHGNCSSRLEVLDTLPVLLPRDLTVFCLDLSGSGWSDGEYISLGYYEEHDLRTVLRHLRCLETVSSIGLWGRSMGASTAILCAAKDGGIAACVLDSAFRDLRTVAEEFVNRGRFPVPQFAVNMAFEVIRGQVSSRAGFDPEEVQPIKGAKLASCPALFAVASDDNFILPHHTQGLYEAWGCTEKTLRVVDGGHNATRPVWFLREASDFLSERLANATGNPCAPTPGKTSLSVAVELRRMGFSDENVGRAVNAVGEYCLEEAVEWLLTGGNPDACPADHTPSAPHRSNRTGLMAGGERDRLDAATLAQQRSVGPPGASLPDQLRYLGFDTYKSDVAGQQCTDLDAAVKWMASRDVSVEF